MSKYGSQSRFGLFARRVAAQKSDHLRFAFTSHGKW